MRLWSFGSRTCGLGGHGLAQAPPATSDEEMEEETTAGGGGVPRTRSSASFGGGARSSPRDLEQPGWAAKLTRKVKKLFCLQTHMQHKMYLAHKREKENRKLQKDFYRWQGMEVASGPEERITDEDEWVYEFSTW